MLLVARLCLVLCHEMATPARPLLLQQWHHVMPWCMPSGYRSTVS